MASFDGFTKTYGDGGFTTNSQQGSQGGRPHVEDSLRPITIKQFLDADPAGDGTDRNAEYRIDGMPVMHVTLIGQVRSINSAATNLTLRLDDGTGLIDVKKYQNDQDGGEDLASPLRLDMHVRVWGRCRPLGGRRHIVADHLRPVTDPNEVNYHALEAAYVHLYYTRGPPGGGGGGGDGDGGDRAAHHTGDSMFTDGPGGGGGGGGIAGGGYDDMSASVNQQLAHRSESARKVYHYLKRSNVGTNGANASVIAREANMTLRDVLTGGNELSDSGMVFQTDDEETWAIL